MDEVDHTIEDLILQGALEVAGIDIDTGEPLYNFTDKLKDVSPRLHNENSKYFTAEVLSLWEYGFITMDVTMQNPMISLTSKSFDKKEIDKLDRQHQYTLKEIIRILMQKDR
jgi:hypothetical protein